MMELKHFWRNLNLVRKLMRLQSAINAEVVGQAASEVNLEEILIRSLIKNEVLKIKEIFNFIEGLDGEVILTGDFNARHPIWESGAKPCVKGKVIAEEVVASKMVLLNDGRPTTIPRINAEPTAMASGYIASITEWEVVEEEFGSCHTSIVMDLQLDVPTVPGKRTKVNKKKAIELLNSIQPQFLYNPEKKQNVFEENIRKASYTITNKKSNYLKRWWNQDIQSAYNEKREQLRIYNRNKTLENQLKMQKARAVFKRTVRKEKRKHDTELKEKIDESTPAKQICNIIRGLDTALTGNKRGADTNPSKEIAEKFIGMNYEQKKAELNTHKLILGLSTDEEVEAPLQFSEFMRVLKSKKDHSAAGMDYISYHILKGLRWEILMEVCTQLDRVWRTNNIPNYSAISCVNHVINSVKEAKQAKQYALAVFLDLDKAFDSVNCQTLLATLAQEKYQPKLSNGYSSI
ncbi:uncharacterized protein LOC135711613 [Ochlerotatus camptorhynchus]|uniref:uncharacterized protein LOC135711613 n=1 Tax=Ochlerotatus camptorhynchus TaxID=644619 RepID=UPI0031CEB616